MKTNCFDAVVDFPPGDKEKSLDAHLFFQGIKVFAFISFYGRSQKEESNEFFVRIHISKALMLKWKNRFRVQEFKSPRILGEGLVLNPLSEKVSQRKIKRRIELLEQLRGDEEEMFLTILREKGILGLREKEIINFSPLTQKSLLRMSQELETEGKIRILSFTPLFLISQESLDFLGQKILSYLTHYHRKHPEQRGESLKNVRKRFQIHPRILTLALKQLVHRGRIKEVGDEVALSGFETQLTSEEEGLLLKLEDMCLKGEFRSVSFDDLQRKFGLSSKTLNRMISLLIERKKIIQGKNGFLLHSRWLDEIILKIKGSGKKELTIADFKKMTGLSRKYAIPLLELLDKMGITRRKGLFREIL